MNKNYFNSERNTEFTTRHSKSFGMFLIFSFFFMFGNAVFGQAAPVGGNVVFNNPTTICLNSSTGNMTLQNHSGQVQRWEKRLNGAPSWTSVANTTTVFSDTPSQAGTWEYRAVVGRGSHPEAYSSSKSFEVPNLTITLVSSNSSGCQNNSNTTFSYTATTGNANRVYIDFDAAATAAGIQQHQDFGVSSGGGTITIQYTWGTAPGVYNGVITVVKDNPFCTSSITYPVTVTISSSTTPITISTHPTNKAICVGTNTSFSVVPSTGGMSYKWQVSTNGGSGYSDLSNGGVYSNVTSATMNITAATAGMANYMYRCIVTGCSGSATSNGATLTFSSTVGTPSTPTPSATTICQGSSNTTYTTLATNATSYNWSVTGTGNTISGTGTTGTVTWAAGFSGTATISVTATGCGTSSAASTTVNVTPTVGTPSTPTPSATTICQGSSNTTYTTSATNATSYTWSVTGTGNTISGTGTTGTVTWAAGFSGTATISVRATGCGTSSAASTTVNVTPTVGTPSTPTPSATTICQGSSNTTYTTSATNATSYTWSVTGTGNTISGTGTTGTVSWAAGFTGSATISVRATGCGTSSAASTTVNVTPTVGTPTAPTPSASTICQGSSNTSYTTSATNATSYSWSVTGTGNTISGTGTTGTVSWAAGFTGIATISVNAIGCGTSSAASTTVTVNSSAIVPTSAVEGVYTFRIDNPNTYTTATANGGQYALVNVVQGYTYTFSVGDTFAGLSEVLTILDASNANVSPATTASGASGASITNWVATLSGQIKVVLSAGNCAPNGTTGTLGIKLDLISVNDTKDDQLAYGADSWIGHVYNFPAGVTPTSVTTGAYNAAMYTPSGLRGYAGYYSEAQNFGIQNFGGGDQYSFPILSNGVNYTNIDTQTFAVRYRMRSTKPAGCYLVTIKGDDGTRLYVGSNTVVANMNNWGDHGITTYGSVLVNFPTNSTNLVFDYYENGGLSQAYFKIVAFDNASNIITPAMTTVCSGTSTTITGSYDYDENAGTTPNTNPSLTFSWESRTNGGAWVPITGITTLDYSPPVINTTTNNIVTEYRRTAKDLANTCSTTSAAITITTTAVPATPGVISGTVAQCPALTSQTYSITAVANATSYEWTVPTGWTITAGGTTSSITVTTGAAGQNGDITVKAKNTCVTSAPQTLAVTVSPTPTLSGATQSIFACNGSEATINLTGLLANSTSTITYTINGGSTQTATGVVANGSGAASFTTGVLTTANDGQTLQITGVATTSCTKSFTGITVPLNVKSNSGSITLTPGSTIASGGSTTFSELSVVQFSIAPIAGATSYTWIINPNWTILSSDVTTNTISVRTGTRFQGDNVQVTASNMLCPSTIMVDLSPIAPTAPIQNAVTPVTCNALGSITLTNLPLGNWFLTRKINGGTGVVDISRSGNTFTITNLAAGSYTFTVTDSYGTSIESNPIIISDMVANTWNGSAWSKGSAPTTSDYVVFAGDYDKLGSVDACSCKVNTGATVTVKSGDVFVIENGLTVEGDMIFENGASLVQHNPLAANVGFITYKRSSSALKAFDYVYWSSPLKNQTIETVFPGSNKMWFYQENLWIPATSTMIPAKGYIVRYSGATTQNAVFVGEPNNGDYLMPVQGLGNNLIGNPYPSAISADDFMIANITVIADYGSLSFWTHNTARTENGTDTKYIYATDDYAMYNLSGSTAAGSGGVPPDGNIASGQSFFVPSKVGSVSFNFTNSMRITDIESNSQFFKQSSTKKGAKGKIEKNRVWLNLTNDEGAFKQLLVGYIQGATNSHDKLYDGKTLDGNAFVDFYSNEGMSNYTIQARGLPFNAEDEVPLGFKTTIAGTFKIAIDKTDGFLTNQAIYLEDKTTNTVHDLKSGAYSFTTAKGEFKDRFVLRYNDSKLGTGDFDPKAKGVIVSVKNRQIKINSFDQTFTTVKLFDLKGSLVYEKNKVNKNEFIIDNLTSATQFMIVMVQLEDGKWITEEIIFHD